MQELIWVFVKIRIKIKVLNFGNRNILVNEISKVIQSNVIQILNESLIKVALLLLLVLWWIVSNSLIKLHKIVFEEDLLVVENRPTEKVFLIDNHILLQILYVSRTNHYNVSNSERVDLLSVVDFVCIVEVYRP